jgi:hypothetical protein
MMRVKAGIFSVTPPAPPDDDGSYLKWHLLDHMPEQYQLPGIVYALRWIADGDYLNSRIISAGPLAEVGNVVNYLLGDPVDQTVEDFGQLGARLAEVGRFPQVRPSLQISLLALQHAYAAPQALISPEVVPFRPHRGVVVVVERPAGNNTAQWLQWLHTDHFPQLLSVPGVAGAWMFGATSNWKIPERWAGDQQYVTVVYLDEDPLPTTKSLAPLIEQRWASGEARPLFAGPLRTMIQWEAWPPVG